MIGLQNLAAARIIAHGFILVEMLQAMTVDTKKDIRIPIPSISGNMVIVTDYVRLLQSGSL
jgi:hypothetical protein